MKERILSSEKLGLRMNIFKHNGNGKARYSTSIMRPYHDDQGELRHGSFDRQQLEAVIDLAQRAIRSIDARNARYSAPKMVELPLPPKNESPVPWLTSIHGTRGRGPYGDRRYRGNCGGFIIRDLLRYFQSKRVLDPMTGSATCRDVCQELDIPCHSFDLREGTDAAEASSYCDIGKFDFVWLHPPYWRMIRYNRDPRCLSNAASLDDFLDRLQQVMGNCKDVLSPGGKIAILIGGYSDRGRYQPLPQLTVHRALEEGLWPACTEIIRFQHGNTSSGRTYRSSFIPGLHDTCLVFESRNSDDN